MDIEKTEFDLFFFPQRFRQADILPLFKYYLILNFVWICLSLIFLVFPLKILPAKVEYLANHISIQKDRERNGKIILELYFKTKSIKKLKINPKIIFSIIFNIPKLINCCGFASVACLLCI